MSWKMVFVYMFILLVGGVMGDANQNDLLVSQQQHEQQHLLRGSSTASDNHNNQQQRASSSNHAATALLQSFESDLQELESLHKQLGWEPLKNGEFETAVRCAGMVKNAGKSNNTETTSIPAQTAAAMDKEDTTIRSEETFS